jgi:hypothetical protein
MVEKNVYNNEVFVLAFRPLANRRLSSPPKEAVLRSLGSVARVVLGFLK